MFTGEQIRQKREEEGMSADQLATKLGVKKANLYKWEKGHRPANPVDFIIIERWLAGEVESVPNGAPKKGRNDAGIDKSEKVDPTVMQVLDRLSIAFANQAAGFLAQTEIMKNIEKNMARQDSQAKIAANLTEVLAGVESLAILRDSAMKEIREGFLSLRADKNPPSLAGGRKKHGIDGDEQKLGKKVALRK